MKVAEGEFLVAEAGVFAAEEDGYLMTLVGGVPPAPPPAQLRALPLFRRPPLKGGVIGHCCLVRGGVIVYALSTWSMALGCCLVALALVGKFLHHLCRAVGGAEQGQGDAAGAGTAADDEVAVRHRRRYIRQHLSLFQNIQRTGGSAHCHPAGEVRWLYQGQAAEAHVFHGPGTGPDIAGVGGVHQHDAYIIPQAGGGVAVSLCMVADALCMVADAGFEGGHWHEQAKTSKMGKSGGFYHFPKKVEKTPCMGQKSHVEFHPSYNAITIEDYTNEHKQPSFYPPAGGPPISESPCGFPAA